MIIRPRLELPHHRACCPLRQPAHRCQGRARPPACHRCAMSSRGARRRRDRGLKARHIQNVERDAPNRFACRPTGVRGAYRSPLECPNQNPHARPWSGPEFAGCRNYREFQALGCPYRCGSKLMAPDTWPSVCLAARRSVTLGSDLPSSGNCSGLRRCRGS